MFADHNFSHRIEKFSFGDFIPSIINPLEGEEKIAATKNNLFQYYIKIVSTDVHTSDIKLKTYQYSTTERDRIIDHNKDSHGMPGIYFKYDLDPIAVRIEDDLMPFSKFILRICAIIGGIHATSGFIHFLVSGITDVITCKYLNRIRSSRLPSDDSIQNQ